MLIVSTTFLSCQSIELQQHHIRLVTFRDINGQLVVDEKESGCWERKYHYGTSYIGAKTDFTEVELDECSKTTGHKTIPYGEAIKSLDSARLDFNRLRGRGD